MPTGVWYLLRQIPSFKPTNTHLKVLKIISPVFVNCLSLWKFYKHQLNNFQITFSLSALAREYFRNKPFGLFLVNLKATDNHFLNVLEKTQSVLGEFYEPVFCEISLATLYTGLPGCHCSWIENSTRFSFSWCLSLFLCWYLLAVINKPLFDRFEFKTLHHFFSCLLNFK